jgi:hypothetical protein
MKNIIKPTIGKSYHQNRFKCSACEQLLFGNKDIVEHTYDTMVSMSSSSLSLSNLQSSQISITGNKSQLTKCACIFLQLTDWMQK